MPPWGHPWRNLVLCRTLRTRRCCGGARQSTSAQRAQSNWYLAGPNRLHTHSAPFLSLPPPSASPAFLSFSQATHSRLRGNLSLNPAQQCALPCSDMIEILAQARSSPGAVRPSSTATPCGPSLCGLPRHSRAAASSRQMRGGSSCSCSTATPGLTRVYHFAPVVGYTRRKSDIARVENGVLRAPPTANSTNSTRTRYPSPYLQHHELRAGAVLHSY